MRQSSPQIKIAVTIVALIMLPVLIESCCMSSCCGEGPAPTVDLMDVKFAVTDFTRVTTSAPPPTTGKPNDYTFLVELLSRVVLEEKSHQRGTMAAYACDPAVYFEQKFQSVGITSNNPMTTVAHGSFAAGADLTSIFKYNIYEDRPIADLLDEELVAWSPVYFIASFSVPAKESHEFTFRFTFTDGSVYERKTHLLELLPE